MSIKSGLYLISTPIGNLGDITLRAIETLQHSDIILCEDTRVSSKLLAKHGIKNSLKIYNDRSDEPLRILIKNLILEGKIISLISDAGTPLISDPGYKLVRDLKHNNLHIDVIPGPCAAISALVLSGLPTDQFLFAGFLPKNSSGKKNLFEKYIHIEATMIFYETSNRIIDSLQVALNVLGDREASIARELTKLHQESRLEKLSKLIEYYENRVIKGEIVLLISGKPEEEISASRVEDQIQKLLIEGKSARDASNIIFAKYKGKISKKIIYQTANRIK